MEDKLNILSYGVASFLITGLVMNYTNNNSNNKKIK